MQQTILSFLQKNYFEDIHNVEKLKGGADNDNYSFESSGKKYVLRIYNEVLLDPREEKDILEEIKFINFFHNHSIPTPTVFPDKTVNLLSKIDDRFCAVFEFAEGDYAYDRLGPIYFEQIGELMGQIHFLTEKYQLKTQKIWQGKQWQGKQLWDYFLIKVEANKDILIEDDLKCIEGIKQKFDLFEKSEQYFIHHDYHFANILFKEDKLSALLDFDSFSKGQFAEDIARFLVIEFAYTTAEEYSQSKPMVKAFFEGYKSQHKLSENDKKLVVCYIDMYYIFELIRLNQQNPKKIPEFRLQIKELKNHLAALRILAI